MLLCRIVYGYYCPEVATKFPLLPIISGCLHICRWKHKNELENLSPTISGCLHEEIVKLGKCICLIAHYIGLSTIYMRLNQGRLKVLSPTILGCLHMQHRELLVSLLLLSPTISGCLHIDGPYTQKRGDLIAHYIGLSTELVLKEKQENKHLSPTISGCLRLGWRVNDNG